MATQYTSILKLALPTTGELSGTWGAVVNDNITSMVEQAIAGLANITTWTTNAHTLTTANGTTAESRCAMLVAADGTGGTALTAAGEIICPALTKLYVLRNSSSYAVTLKTASGTGVAVPSGNTAFLFCDGTNVLACVTTIVDGRITGNLTVDGNTTLGNATSDTITATARFASGLIPSADNTQDLGSSGNSWKDLYIDGTAYLALVDINGGTIDGATIGGSTPAAGTFTTATATTGNITTVNATTVDTTNIEVTNIKAKDGTASATIADSTGVMTITSSVLTTTDINGGTIDDTTIGGTTPAAGTFTTATATTGNITTVNATTVDTTNIEVTNIKAKDGTASATIADSTGAVTVSTLLNVDNLRLDGNTLSSTNTNGNIAVTPNGTGEVDISKVDIDGGTIDATVIGGATRAAGSFTTLDANGNVTLGDATSDTITATGRFNTDLVPSTTNTRSLGASTLVWANVYATAFTESGAAVVSQTDTGTAPNEIPLNQYLGALAYQDTETPALAVGTGITAGTGTICKVNGGLSGGIYRVTILVDLTGLNSGGTAGDIIGVNGTANPCYIALLPDMIVLGGRMTCLETPAGGDTDIDLYSATEGTGVEDQAITALTETQIINAGSQTAGTVTYFAADPVANTYLYLVGQSTSNATYTAGRFLIEIFGVQ